MKKVNLNRVICLVLAFSMLMLRLYNADPIYAASASVSDSGNVWNMTFELLNDSGILDRARQASSQSTVSLTMGGPELGSAAASISASVSWGAVAILAVCVACCLGFGYANASDEEKEMIKEWLRDKWDLACEYYNNMSTWCRGFLAYMGKLIDTRAMTLAIGTRELSEAIPEISEDGWNTIRNHYIEGAVRGLPLDLQRMSVAGSDVLVKGEEVKTAIHSLMSDLYSRLGRSNNALPYSSGAEYSKTVNTLFETKKVVLPSTPVNVWGNTPFGVKVLSNERSYNYGWRMGYVNLQYHFIGTDGIKYFLSIGYNKKLSI